MKVCFIDRNDVFDGPNDNLCIEHAHVAKPFPVRLVKNELSHMCGMRLRQNGTIGEFKPDLLLRAAFVRGISRIRESRRGELRRLWSAQSKRKRIRRVRRSMPRD